MTEDTQIAVVLDTYDDIFSDFDPRSYGQREVSKDFIDEVQRRYMETPSDRMEVRFLLPQKLRDEKTEGLIRRRLREHFAFEAKQVKKEIGGLVGTGIRWFIMGAAIQLAGLFVLLYFGDDNPLARAADVLLAPAGWFGVFMGIDKIVNEPTALRKQAQIWHRFTKANFIFLSEPANEPQALSALSTSPIA